MLGLQYFWIQHRKDPFFIGNGNGNDKMATCHYLNQWEDSISSRGPCSWQIRSILNSLNHKGNEMYSVKGYDHTWDIPTRSSSFFFKADDAMQILKRMYIVMETTIYRAYILACQKCTFSASGTMARVRWWLPFEQADWEACALSELACYTLPTKDD